SKRTRGRGTRTARAGSKRNLPARCVFPECKKPHRGPRFSFLCAEHSDISKSDKKKHLAAWRAAHVVAPKNGTAKRMVRPHRNGQPDQAAINQVFKVVEGEPGLRSEQIYKKVPLSPEVTKKALAKLREEKRVKTKGERRATTYAS